MGRYRPPRKQGSAYITPEGARRLKEELSHLWKEKRPEVTRALSDAAAEGDRSENAEYTYRKKQLGEIDRRIRYLTKRLEALTVVHQKPTDESVIFFGAWFRLEDEQGEEIVYRLVGPDEFDGPRGHISIDSPMGRAVLKKTVGDEFCLRLAGGEKTFVVLDVRYSPLVRP